jgi:hypothetical protein
MHYVDSAGASSEGLFTEGDVQQGIPATTVGSDIANAIMLEIIHVIEARGIPLDKFNNYQLLQAIGDSAQGHKNYLINGGFQLAQRGNSFTGPARTIGDTETYTLDRWLVTGDDTGGAGEVDVLWEPVLDEEVERIGTLPASQQQNRFKALKWLGRTLSTVGGPLLEQRTEAIYELQQETITFSIYIKSSVAINGVLSIVQDFGSGGTASPQVVVGTKNITIAGNGEYLQYSVSADCPTIIGKTIHGSPSLRVRYKNLVGELANGDEVEFALAQLEKGTAPSKFDYRPISVELLMAYRYFETSYVWGNGNPIGDNQQDGGQQSAHVPAGGILIGLGQRFRVEKRSTPTVTWYDPDTGDQGRLEVGHNDTKLVVSSTGLSAQSTGDPGTNPAPQAAIGVVGHWTAEAEI